MEDFLTWVEMSIERAKAMRQRWDQGRQPDELTVHNYQQQRRNAILDDPEAYTPSMSAFYKSFNGMPPGHQSRETWKRRMAMQLPEPQPFENPMGSQEIDSETIFQAVLNGGYDPFVNPEQVERYILHQGTEEQKQVLELAYLVQRSLNRDEIKDFLRVAMGNANMISLWAKDIMELPPEDQEQAVIKKFEDWRARGIFKAA